LHPTLKTEATKAAGFNFLQQQERLDDYIRVYNHVRPHPAPGDAYPSEILEMGSRIGVFEIFQRKCTLTPCSSQEAHCISPLRPNIYW
jgi:hypothetical protein